MEIYKKFEFFHLDQCQLVGYVNNFYVSSVSMCQWWIFFVLGDEPIREVCDQKGKNVKIVHPN